MPHTHFPGAGILEEDPGALSLRPDSAPGLIWAALIRACCSRESPWRTPVLSTVSPDGAPESRILVLRAVDPAGRRLELHSDSRSAKFRSLAANPRVELCFWDPRSRLQLRLRGEAGACADPQRRESAWAKVPGDSRRNYRSESAPGAPAVSDSPNHVADGFAHFAILDVNVRSLEWLWLASAGHERGRAIWNGVRWGVERLVP